MCGLLFAAPAPSVSSNGLSLRPHVFLRAFFRARRVSRASRVFTGACCRQPTTGVRCTFSLTTHQVGPRRLHVQAMPAAPTPPAFEHNWVLPWCGASKGAAPKRPRAPPGPAPTPRVSRKPCHQAARLYHDFCREQRPLLPPNVSNANRERVLGEFMIYATVPAPQLPLPPSCPYSCPCPCFISRAPSPGLSPSLAVPQACAGKHSPRRRRPSTKGIRCRSPLRALRRITPGLPPRRRA